MKIFITGEIVSTKTEGCFSPIDLKEKLESVDKNEPLEVEITSEGGSVFAGVQIANMLSRHQGMVTTHAVGICASIATIILMAGDKVAVDDNCFCMIHRPWSCVEGNADDMTKEIEALHKCEIAMIGYYMKWSNVDKSTLQKYLADETWFLGEEFAKVFKCNVVPSDKEFNIAAKFKKCKYAYRNVPKGLSMEEKQEKTKEEVEQLETAEEPAVEEKKVEPAVEEKTEEPAVEEKTEEPAVEEKKEEPAVEEKKDEDIDKEEIIEQLKTRILELETKLAQYEKEEDDKEYTEEETVTKEECEKRVSGMQAKMQRQINDFVNQLKVRDEELAKAKAEAIRLQNELETSSNELSKLTSALVEKENALAMLNASVNARPVETKPSGWGKLEGEDFFNYLKKNNGILTIRNK